MTEHENKKNIRLGSGEGRCRVLVDAKFIGPDIVVMLWGGDCPHIGSVAVSVPYQRAGEDNNRATTSVYNFIGHMDDELSKMLSEKITTVFNIKAVVTAGVHLNNISSEDIAEIRNNTEKVCSMLLSWLGG